MPPEQASGSIKEVGKSADVYALGALLYVLVAGRPPFQADNPLDTLMQVLERVPISPRELNPALSRDIETISMKCLEKPPRNRYASAQDVADELRRFLSSEPIHARPISSLERARRWCRRNPVVSSLSFAIMVLLIVGTVVSAYFARREALQAEMARQETRRAYGHYYIAEMNLARRDWDAADPGNLLKRLENTLPHLTNGHDYRGFEWFYWDRLCHSELFTVQHPDRVYGVALDPDGSRFATANADRTVKLWDSQNGSELAALIPPDKNVPISIDFSPDGRQLAVGTIEGVVFLWDVRTEQIVLQLDAHDDSVNAVVFSPDGERLASAGDEAVVKLWDARSGEPISRLEGGGSSLAFDPDGRLLASVGKGGRQGAYVWDSLTENVIHTLQGRGGRILYDAVFSPDGTRLATGSEDGTVRVWETKSGKELFSFAENKSVLSVDFSPDGKRLASGGLDRTVKIWDVESGKEFRTFVGHIDTVKDVAFDTNGTRVVSCSADGATKVWDLDAPPTKSMFEGHTGSVTSVTCSLENGSLVSGKADKARSYGMPKRVRHFISWKVIAKTSPASR